MKYIIRAEHKGCVAYSGKGKLLTPDRTQAQKLPPHIAHDKLEMLRKEYRAWTFSEEVADA